MSSSRRKWILSGFAVCFAALVGTVAFALPSSAGVDEAQIRSAFEQAVTASQQIGAVSAENAKVTEPSEPALKNGSYDAKSFPELTRLTQEQVTRTTELTLSRLEHSFSGEQLQRELRTAHNLLESYDELTTAPRDGEVGDYILQGGADAFVYSIVTAQESSADVSATYDTWLNYASISPAGATVMTPRNTIIANAHLIRKGDGRWVVDELSWTFATGSEP